MLLSHNETTCNSSDGNQKTRTISLNQSLLVTDHCYRVPLLYVQVLGRNSVPLLQLRMGESTTL